MFVIFTHSPISRRFRKRVNRLRKDVALNYDRALLRVIRT